MNDVKKLNLTVASSPHVASPIDTQNLMRDVLIALVPALVFGVVFFGPRALVATIISVLACEFFEWGYRKLMHKSMANKDLSAAVTGVLLAFVCAPTLPYWMLIIGDFFAIVVVKQLFGGLGQNFMNPALAGRAFLMLCYPVAMTTWVVPGIGTDKWAGLLSGSVTMTGADVVTGATPPLRRLYARRPAARRVSAGRLCGATWAAVSVRFPPWLCWRAGCTSSPGA